MTDYESGVCNINQNESRKRYAGGLLSLFAVSFISVSYILNGSLMLLLLVALTSIFGVQGILQGRENFCVAHAKQGTHRTGNETEQVSDEGDKEADSSKADSMILKSVLTGLALTASVYVIDIFLI